MVIFVLQFVVFNFTSDLKQSPALLIFLTAPFFTSQCSRLIVNSVSKTPYYFLEHLHLQVPVYLAILVFSANHMLGLGLPELPLTFILIAYGMVNSYWFTTNAIAQITEALDIYCLTIKRQTVFEIEAPAKKVN